MQNTKFLVNLLDDALKPRGFEKVKLTWYHDHPELVHVVNLQKSDYGGQFFINVNISLHSINDNPRLPFNQCQIHERADQLSPKAAKLSIALDLENISINDKERGTIIREIINDEIVVFFSRCTNKAALKELLQSGQYKNIAVWAIVYKDLGFEHG